MFGGTVHGHLPPRTVPIITRREGRGVTRKIIYEPVSVDLLVDENGNHPAPHPNCEAPDVV
jgi:hypothetical protein